MFSLEEQTIKEELRASNFHCWVCVGKKELFNDI